MFIGARPIPSPDASLRARWADLRRARPGICTRDAALALGVREAELLASACGAGVTRLACAWGELVAELPALGPVLAATRNALAVHEKRGGYARVDIRGTTGLVLNDAINLRLFFAHWQHGFAVTDGQSRSFEFFDRAGRAVHKIFLEPDSRGAVYDTLVARHASPDQSPGEPASPAAVPPQPGAAPDPEAFRDRWALLQGPEDADTLVADSGITRHAALRLISPSWAYPVGRQSLQRLVAGVAADRTPITLSVGNPGAIQRHTGAIRRVYSTSRWLHVRDLSLHLRVCTERIASAWVVKLPSRDGLVTVLELLDAGGTPIVTACAARWPGQVEPERWRVLIARLRPVA